MLNQFSDGVSLALQAYEMRPESIQIEQLDMHLAAHMLVNRDVAGDMDSMRTSLEKASKFKSNTVHSEAARFLENLYPPRASDVNIEAFSNFLHSLGSHILAITICGRSQPIVRGTVFGRRIPSVKSTLITTGMGIRSVFEALQKVETMSAITKAVVISKRVDSDEAVRASAVCIVSFLKVLHVLGHIETYVSNSGTESDRCANKATDAIHIKFEGTFSLSEYVGITEKRKSTGFQFLSTNKRNVYIIGPNGSGKSTWGNLFLDGGVNAFSVGDSVHTTLIPESVDVPIDNSGTVRVWDTPGLFDGSEEQAHMEAHMHKVIDQHVYFLAVIFVFNGSQQSNKMTLEILDYATRTFGERVKTAFVAIINDKDGNAGATSNSYWDHLSSRGFKLRNDTFFVASAKHEGEHVTTYIKDRLAKMKPFYIAKHRDYFDTLTKKNGGDFSHVLADVNARSHEQIHNFIDSGKVRLAVNDSEGFFDGYPPAHKVCLRLYESRYFFLKIGYSKKTPVDQKVILLDESLKRSDRSINLLNRTTAMEQKRIFLNHILKNPNNVLMSSISDEFDFILFDYSKMNPITRQETMEINILKNKNFGLDDTDGLSDTSSSLSRTISTDHY